MRPSKMTPEIDALFAEEAERRAARKRLKDRMPTKLLADQSGLAYAYVANIISRKRRAIEAKVNISVETSTFTQANVNS